MKYDRQANWDKTQIENYKTSFDVGYYFILNSWNYKDHPEILNPKTARDKGHNAGIKKRKEMELIKVLEGPNTKSPTYFDYPNTMGQWKTVKTSSFKLPNSTLTIQINKAKYIK